MKNFKNILFGILLGASIGIVFAADNFNTSDVVEVPTDPTGFPADSISGDQIDGGTYSNFTSTGITDEATGTTVNIEDAGVWIGDNAPVSQRSLSIVEATAQVALNIEGSRAEGVIFDIEAKGGASADPVIRFTDTLGRWVIGYDNDDSNLFKIGTTLGFGSNVFFTINTLGRVSLNGSFVTSAETITAVSDTLDDSNNTIWCDASSNAVTLNLPTSVGRGGIEYRVKKVDSTSNDCIVDAFLTQTIDGELTKILGTENQALTVKSDNANWNIIQATPTATVNSKSESILTGSSGIYYIFGHYAWNATDANLTQASATVTVGAANISHGAHGSLVAAAAGAASGGAGAVEIEVSGTSITDAGVETTSDTEILIADITTMSTDEYFETTKKWTGTITYTLQNAGGSTQTTFNADFNYGLSVYEDRDDRDFTVVDLTTQILGGATDTGFDIELLHHSPSNWTYVASGFVPGNGIVAQFTTDSPTNSDLASGMTMNWKRKSLSTAISGSTNEGYIGRLTTGANNSVAIGNLSVGVTF